MKDKHSQSDCCHCTRHADDETTGVSCLLRGQSLPFIFLSCALIGPGRPVSGKLPLRSLMTDLKDSSLSLLLQITSSDMFGHADNVLSENSFQGWMGYKLSTPRVGYFFNCCFIPLKRELKRDQKKRDRKNLSAGFKDYGLRKDGEAP